MAALVAACVLFFGGLAWVAWFSDDAFITFRCMDNLVGGRGLTWNVDERVQAFTNPLWLFLLAGPYALTGSFYWTTHITATIVTAAVIALLVRGARTLGLAALGVLLLAGSKAFLEYSSSGLENPLLHLALLACVGGFLAPGDPHRRVLRVAAASSVAFLTRPDALLLTGILCGAAWIESPSWRSTRALLLGWAPIFAWELFSLVYYGTPVPNTAIAKLSSGLPEGELAEQGLRYLANSLSWDPLTLSVIAIALASVLPRPGRWVKRETVVGLALAAHLAYVVSVGGDFMTGRFLTGSFVVAVALLSRAPVPRVGVAGLAVAALVLANVSERSPWRPRPDHLGFMSATALHGISDEHSVYYAYTAPLGGGYPGWGRLADGDPYPPGLYAQKLLAEGQRVQVHPQVGMLGFFAGPEIHIVDPMGLADPLLSRMPIASSDGRSLFGHRVNAQGRFWRIGHFAREIPEGYRASLRVDDNRVADPALHSVYETVRALTREPLWTKERWAAIARELSGRTRARVEAWRRERTAELNGPR